MDSERAFEIALAKRLGYTARLVDECNQRANQWTLVDPTGRDYMLCMRTEDELWTNYAPRVGDFEFVRFSHVEVVARFGAMGWLVSIEEDGAMFIGPDLNDELRKACREWTLWRYGDEIKV